MCMIVCKHVWVQVCVCMSVCMHIRTSHFGILQRAEFIIFQSSKLKLIHSYYYLTLQTAPKGHGFATTHIFTITGKLLYQFGQSNKFCRWQPLQKPILPIINFGEHYKFILRMNLTDLWVKKAFAKFSLISSDNPLSYKKNPFYENRRTIKTMKQHTTKTTNNESWLNMLS